MGLWKGRRIIAADGSTLRLPESSDIITYFGRYNCGEKVPETSCPVLPNHHNWAGLKWKRYILTETFRILIYEK
jgi:hypothetical protein